MTTAICKICGKPESDHHSFIEKPIPPGCVCDPRDWGPVVWPICDRFAQSKRIFGCARCQHEKGCHQSPAAALVEAEG